MAAVVQENNESKYLQTDFLKDPLLKRQWVFLFLPL